MQFNCDMSRVTKNTIGKYTWIPEYVAWHLNMATAMGERRVNEFRKIAGIEKNNYRFWNDLILEKLNIGNEDLIR